MHTTRCGFCSFEKRATYFPPAFTPKMFDNNEPSHPSEAFTLRQSLTEMRREMEHVNMELEFAEAAITRMKATHFRLSSFIKNHEKALRPILSIPDDILRLIFEWTVQSCSDWQSFQLLDLQRAPQWSISHTCSRWRALAISFRPLWCTLIVPEYNRNFLLLELSVHRSASAQCGYIVDLQSRGEPVTDNDAFRELVMPVLKPTSRRWNSLTTYATCSFVIDLLEGWSFERLATLDLSLQECTHNTSPIVITAFRDTPRLRRVRLEFLSHDHQLDIPWGQLVFFESRCCDLGILHRLSAVETILIDDRFEGNWVDTSNILKTKAPIRFPSLHSLSLYISSDNDVVRDLSEMLEVPSLRRLRVSFYDSFTAFRCPTIHFLENLTHVSLAGVHMSDYLLGFLRCATRVRVLYIGGGAFDGPLLDGLQTDILPCLECLQTEERSIVVEIAAEVMKLVERRRWRLSLVQVWTRVEWGDRIPEDLSDKWKSLCELGMITFDSIDSELRFDKL